MKTEIGDFLDYLTYERNVSPNTIKTHVARVYEKLEVARRVQAIEKARWLRLIP